MTVKELIKVLKKFPKNMLVLTDGQKQGYENILLPDIITVYRDEEAMSEFNGEYDVHKIDGEEPIEAVVIFRDNRWD